jgi:hypothetical protein
VGGRPVLYYGLVLGVVNVVDHLGGSVLGEARNPLEWFPFGRPPPPR